MGDTTNRFEAGADTTKAATLAGDGLEGNGPARALKARIAGSYRVVIRTLRDRWRR